MDEEMKLFNLVSGSISKWMMFSGWNTILFCPVGSTTGRNNRNNKTIK